ncbi:N-acyl-D-amino-acid deacylase family protein [Deminuibacter soli]|uniref:D-aminoacylase n=1 Tax=Deminuibacter soli TaxID=2291815 RepID=A0A3E1NRT1_9BACT|nr:D-aminoacylase [Deminuibacter soli]RFM30636.1 D-aminoacylase [Deminuibacter soli]
MRKIFALLLLAAPVTLGAQVQADILIQHGRIIDGSGNPWFYGDIAIKDGKIIAIGQVMMQAAQVIDAHNHIVAPGFIDVHTHIEDDEVKQPTADNFINDGVTTVITGNCGASRVQMDKYFHFLDSLHLSVNVASLIGHNDVREAVLGNANRDPSEAEMLEMEHLVAKAMEAGAVGLSTGLIYTPGTYSKTPEVVRLAKIAALYHGVYASHIRDEGDSVVQAIEEAINISKVAGLPVEISHFKVSGQQNWGRSKETLPLVINARKAGVDVTIDQYPYTASSTSLGTLLPEWALADNQDSINARINNPVVRERIIAAMLQKLRKRSLKHFSYAVVASFSADSSFNGKSIEAINLQLNRKHKASAEAETVLDMMKKGGAGMVFHGMSEADVKYIMQYPFNMFASDASIRVFGKGVPHPRGYGTNARVLGKYVREEKVLTLEEAVRRMTSLPAQKFQLKNRGLLREGFAADIVIFDETTVTDKSSFEQPHQYSTGFDYVLVNGKITAVAGKGNGSRNGLVLRKQNVAPAQL